MSNSSNFASQAGERKLWLDALRGVAMIFVVFGHSCHAWPYYFAVTSPIKMPLFFAISAYLFKPRGGNQKEFYKSLFQKIVVPWVVLGMFPYVHPVERFGRLISGEIHWFMPCLIITEILWFYIHKFSKNDKQIVILGVIASALGFAMHYAHILRFAMIDTAFVVQIFFVMGYLIRKREDVLCEGWKRKLPILILAYFLIEWFCTEYIWLDVHVNLYRNIPLCMLLIAIGCVALFMMFRMLNVAPKWLVFVGQNTLLIYMLHTFGFLIYNVGMKVLNLNVDIPAPLEGLIKTAISVTACCVLALFVNRYIPEIAGKKRSPKQKNPHRQE